MKSILILGGAKCVWEDVESLGAWEHDVAAVNDIGAKWSGPLAFWASLHPRKFKHWEKQRRLNGYPNGYVKYSHKYGRPMVDYVHKDWGGSSGLFAVKIARLLAYDNIILAGMPMESDQSHYFNKSQEWVDAVKYRDAWVKREEEIKPFVSSCSGWTRRFLGGPNMEKAFLK